MMSVELLRPLVEAMLLGPLPLPVVDAVHRWGGQLDTVTHIRSSSNHLFRFAQADQWRFLRLTPVEKRPKEQIIGELTFIHYLADQGLLVAKPLPSLTNQLIETIEWEEHSYYAVVFTALRGQQWTEPHQLPLAVIHAWGSTLAQFHRASQALAAQVTLCRPSWQDAFLEAREWLPVAEKVAHYELASVYEWLSSLPTNRANYGLIHRDLELDNLLWDGQRFQVLDFDDALYHWYAADIAAALDELWLDPRRMPPQWFDHFLQGYAAILGDVEISPEALHQFLRCIRILDFAQVLHAYHATPKGADAPWLANMRKHSTRWLRARRKLFVENVIAYSQVPR